MKGSADLATRFILRADRLLSKRGQLGFVTTKTIAKGAPLHVGMEQVTKSHLTIRAARSPHPWPTRSASLQIVEFWASCAKPSKHAAYWVDGEEVPAIRPDLQSYGQGATHGRPQRLRENEDIAFTGTTVLGPGFTLTEDRKREIIAGDQHNSEVIDPYVIGRDLNQRPDCSGSRWIINFGDWPLQRASDYPDCLGIVQRLVKPERDKNRYSKSARERWWLYERSRRAICGNRRPQPRTCSRAGKQHIGTSSGDCESSVRSAVRCLRAKRFCKHSIALIQHAFNLGDSLCIDKTNRHHLHTF